MFQPSILLVIEGTYPWYRGGVSEWVHQYLRHFKGVNFKILQVATDQYLNSDVNNALYHLPDNVSQFKRIPPPDLLKAWDRESVKWFERFGKSLSNIFANINLVHIANTGFAGWLGMKLSNILKKPLLLTEHALYWKEIDMGAVALECGYQIPEYESEKKRLTGMFKSLAEQIYGQSNEVISVSKCNISLQKKMGADAVRYIPNGVEEKWLDNKKRNNDKLTVGWIGRCAEMKNPLKFFDLVEAFRRSAITDTDFIMMSCDANETGLQLKIEDKLAEYSEVRFVWNQATEKYLSEMNALCITSHNESQPLVLFEAISKKVLPIGWEAGDVTDEYGLILPKKTTPEALVSQLHSLWSSKKQWNAKVDHLYNTIKKDHTWNHIFDDYREVFSHYL